MFHRSFVLLLLLTSSTSFADPLPFLPEDMLTRDSLLGDWEGMRPHLAKERGVTLSAIYIGEVFSNLSGGYKTGTAYEGLLEMAIEADLEKLTGGAWKGATFYVSALLPHGRSPSANYVGDVFGVSNIDAPHEISLYELWIEQNVDIFSIRLGQVTADSEFAISDVGSLFLNGTFGWPAGISANANAPAYPSAGLGVRLRIDLHENASFSAGIYDGDPSDFNSVGAPTNLHGTQWRLSKEQGMFAIFEFAYAHHQSPTPHQCHIPPGFVKIGTWFHTGEFPDLKTGKVHSNNFGIYAIADQKLFVEGNEGDQGLSGFGRFFYSPANRSFIDYYCDCGLVYTGLIPSRDQDHFGLAFGYGNISGDLADAQRAANPNFYQSDTAVLEVSYLAQLTPYFSMQPDLQYVIQPDGAARSEDGLPDAIVAGLRFQIDF